MPPAEPSPRISAEHREAVDVHSRQAVEFASSYETLDQDPYRSCFTYSRMRLRAALDAQLPRSGSGLRAIDVGCGTGHHMRDLISRGFDVVGVDGSQDMLDQARQANQSAELYQCDVDSIPFESHSFDLAICIEVLRYLPDPSGAISEIARILRPGGICLATAAPLFSINGYPLVNRLATVAPVGDLVRLKQYFTTPSGLRREFANGGFVDVDIEAVYTGPLNWVEHLSPGRLPSFLHHWESIDAKLSHRPRFKGLSNMLLVKAVKA